MNNRLTMYELILTKLKNFKNKVFSKKSFNNHKDLYQLILDSTDFLDNQASLSERLYCIFNGITERVMCPVCKEKPLKFNGHKKEYHWTGCCPKCSKNNKVVKQKTEQTNVKRYGFTSHNKSLEVKKKKEQTCLQRYGVTNPSYIPDVIEKRKTTSLKNNGVDCVLKLDQVHKKRNDLSMETSYRDFILNCPYDQPCFSIEEYIERKNPNDKLKFRCSKCGYVFESIHYNGKHSRCPRCYKNGKSFYEQELVDFLNTYKVPIKQHIRKVIPPQELDIYIESKKIAFEFDGLYWHSYEVTKKKDTQLRKTLECESKGVQLIHIFENEWLSKREIVESRIKNLLGIYDTVVFARKTEVREIDSKTSNAFQLENHIQGSSNSKVNLGLFHRGQLVSINDIWKAKIHQEI